MPRSVTPVRLPEFSLAGYSSLLAALKRAGFELQPLRRLGDPDGPAAFLRHDIDIHARGVDAIGRIEEHAGASATYFVALTQPYNPAYPSNRVVLRELVALGHSIGLHYDLTTYPADLEAARDHLMREVRWLESLVESPVEAICMHKPWDGLPDIFAVDVPEGLLNPASEEFGSVRYVSDSCRAWRDETLLDCLRTPPASNLQLNTHPELWLGAAGDDRHRFLEVTLVASSTADAREFLLEVEQPGWRCHPAPRNHDAREAGAAE